MARLQPENIMTLLGALCSAWRVSSAGSAARPVITALTAFWCQVMQESQQHSLCMIDCKVELQGLQNQCVLTVTDGHCASWPRVHTMISWFL